MEATASDSRTKARRENLQEKITARGRLEEKSTVMH
jgi:hypothetical protein